MNASDWTRGWESCRLMPYDDRTGLPIAPRGLVLGTLTVGYGHTGQDVVAGEAWDQARCDAAFAIDHQVATENALRVLGHGVEPLGEARWGALADMAFQLGRAGLEGFVQMIAALQHGDWPRAARELDGSRYAEQTPRRARFNGQIIVSGNWLSPHPNDPTIL